VKRVTSEPMIDATAAAFRTRRDRIPATRNASGTAPARMPPMCVRAPITVSAAAAAMPRKLRAA
jgi:hypothetical protein